MVIVEPVPVYSYPDLSSRYYASLMNVAQNLIQCSETLSLDVLINGHYLENEKYHVR